MNSDTNHVLLGKSDYEKCISLIFYVVEKVRANFLQILSQQEF